MWLGFMAPSEPTKQYKYCDKLYHIAYSVISKQIIWIQVGETPIASAARCGKVDMVVFLKEKGANISGNSNKPYT